MLILFDHGSPRGIAGALPGHTVTTAYERGWERLSHGDLLQAAEAGGFDLLLTTDRRIRYQQNLSSRRIALVVVTGSTKWSQVRLHLQQISDTVNRAQPGSYAEVEVPFPISAR